MQEARRTFSACSPRYAHATTSAMPPHRHLHTLPALLAPELLPPVHSFTSVFESRGLCCRSCFGPRTCGRGATNSSKRQGSQSGFPLLTPTMQARQDLDGGVGGSEEMCTMHAGVMLCIVFVPNPQLILSSPAAAPAAAGPVPHAHPVASTRPLDPTPHAHAAFCVGVPAVARCPPPSHAGRREYSVSVLLSDVPLPRRRAPPRRTRSRRAFSPKIDVRERTPRDCPQRSGAAKSSRGGGSHPCC